MDKTYDPKSSEPSVYTMWEEGGYFTPDKTDLKKLPPGRKPFSIVLPLPNANDSMHMGHALFTVQDILIRYHRMKGDPTLWLPGGDHAGIETQYVFEKKLAKEGSSRFDYDRDTLYRMIGEYVEKNKTVNRDQMKRLGFSLDWTRYCYSLDPDIVTIVMETFRKMHADDLVYRDERLVNFCTKCGTSYSDLEIVHVEQTDPLYYMKYGPFVLATVRPETKFGDTAVAVNPKDKRYKQWIGKDIQVDGLLGPFTIRVVADDAIDQAFGTGAAKVTPAHDFTDFEIARRHNLPLKQVIGLDGRLTGITGPYAGLRVKAARIKVAEDLRARGLMDHIDETYTHSVATCYRCGTVIEPLPIPQWYIKTKPLATKAIQAVKDGKTKIFPLKRFEKMYFDWLNNILDWNISRQIVWGPRIPVWYCLDCNPDILITFVGDNKEKVSGTYARLKDTYTYDDIMRGLQTVMSPLASSYSLWQGPCKTCGGTHTVQETDTFDTWFLSSQWPYTTLMATGSREAQRSQDLHSRLSGQVQTAKPETLIPSDFEYFYPTSVLDTMWDILFFWVARMMMMGLYTTGNVPFEVIHLHSRVVDPHGQKMSKSKGNVINPIEMTDKYGADALRMALMYGAGPGSDIALSEDKIRGMRNFANKIWNIGRLITISFDALPDKGKTVPWYDTSLHASLTPKDKQMISEVNMLIAGTTKDVERYRFSDAILHLYDFIWHTLADTYLEENKSRYASGDLMALSVLRHVFMNILKLLHPFAPFVTETLYQKIPGWDGAPLIISSWPAKTK